MSADTSTIVVTGRMSPNTSACTAATFLPPADVGDEHPGAHHVGQRRTGLAERDLDAAQRFPGLRRNVITGCGGACDDDERADAHGAGVADPVLERGP